MKVLVLGGMGIQGRGACLDLCRSPGVEEVVVGDLKAGDLANNDEMKKARGLVLDAGDPEQLKSAMDDNFDVVLDLLPRKYNYLVAQTGIEVGVSVVNTNYGDPLRPLHEAAKQKGIIILPESDFDPGADLVLYKHGMAKFEKLEVIRSYCGGVPEKGKAGNPLDYKLSWPIENLFNTLMRPSRLLKDGETWSVSAAAQHHNDFIHTIDVAGIGTMEAIPNGDAVYYTDLLGITGDLVETGRYSLRWPGWSVFWHAVKEFGFLSKEKLVKRAGDPSPYEFTRDLLGPQLSFHENEKDLVILLNVFEGIRNGKPQRFSHLVYLERGMDTELMGMTMAIGYTSSIIAQMVGNGEIKGGGVLSPILDIPYEAFTKELKKRNFLWKESFVNL